MITVDSWVEVEFYDGSMVTLSGQAAVTISDQDQKELPLEYGRPSANVESQPIDKPMFVHTQAAERKVVRTQFNVDAQVETRKLTVNEGSVYLTRATDGKRGKIPSQRKVIASIDDQNGLAPKQLGKSLSTWQSDPKSDVVHRK